MYIQLDYYQLAYGFSFYCMLLALYIHTMTYICHFTFNTWNAVNGDSYTIVMAAKYVSCLLFVILVIYCDIYLLYTCYISSIYLLHINDISMTYQWYTCDISMSCLLYVTQWQGYVMTKRCHFLWGRGTPDPTQK